jgi:LEA14-like dessication related protein
MKSLIDALKFSRFIDMLKIIDRSHYFIIWRSPMNIRPLWNMFIVLCLLSGTAFGQFPKVKIAPPQKPTIVYDRVDIKSVTMEKTEIEFVYIVDNPNSVGIDGVLADYELFLKGNSTAVGKDMKFTIPAGGKSELKLPLEINYVNVFKSAADLTKAVLGGEKTIPFKMDILFKIDWKVLKFNVPITAEGELPLPEVKPAAPAPADLKKKIKF